MHASLVQVPNGLLLLGYSEVGEACHSLVSASNRCVAASGLDSARYIGRRVPRVRDREGSSGRCRRNRFASVRGVSRRSNGACAVGHARPGGLSADCHRQSSSASVSVTVRARESSSVCACMSKYVESIFSSSPSWKVPETKVEAHADGHRMYTHTDNLWQHGTPTHAKCLRAPFRLCHIAQ